MAAAVRAADLMCGGVHGPMADRGQHLTKSKCGSYSGYKWVSYNFPCSVFSNGSGNSIPHLHLASCAFHPVAGLACLTKLHLFKVDITGDELGCFLSNSFAIEELNLIKCGNVIHLKIPCLLRRLNCLAVQQCGALKLKVTENKAPNLWIVGIDCQLEKVLFGDVLQVKDLRMLGFYESNLVHYARAKLPFIMPNLETLSIRSAWEVKIPKLFFY
ncbi:F-box protein [Hordeum vulgare]|nr:F-box protein [Hordeum vulgare]